ncbi:MAG TPA: chemotaxis protein CheA [Thermodesulfobacteriota bacterium]|nr:chemotaxis protein CheA [Thermodesulfobacteriota bacterium]
MPDDRPRPDADVLAVFRREAEEQAARAEAALLALERDPEDRAALRALFRALHTLKGNAACAGLSGLEAAVHRLETLLHPLREGERRVEREAVDALFPLLYGLRDAALLDAPLPGDEAFEALSARVARTQAGAPRPASRFRLAIQYPGEPVAAAFDPPFVLADLADLGEIRSAAIDPDSVLPLSLLERPEALYLRYVVELATPRTIDEVHEGCLLVEQAVRVTIEPVEEAPGARPADADAAVARGTALRIDAGRLDRLTTLASEIAVGGARLRRLLEEGAPEAAVREVLDHLDTACEALHAESLAARMISIDELLRPFARLVRELAATLGKRVRLTIEGRDVELDKALVEHMREPLTHLVRNAVDHGIEPPEARVAAGKAPEGHLVIAASQREGSIYLVVRDDGRGLDRSRIRERAVARGLVSPDRVLTDEETDQLIFESGLSTAERITNVSGRGIGMDIVRRSIEQVHGEIRVASEPGRGCTFQIRLPLTLAVIDGFLAGLADEVVVIPVHAVSEVVELPAAAARHERIGVMSLRGAALPYLRLRERFGLEGPAPGREHVVVVSHEGNRVGLVVDTLLGQARTVVKSLGRFLGGLPLVSGATVLWNGRVALILDVPGLLREIAGEAAAALQPA